METYKTCCIAGETNFLGCVKKDASKEMKKAYPVCDDYYREFNKDKKSFW